MKFIVLVLAFVCLSQARHVRDVQTEHQNMFDINQASETFQKVFTEITTNLENARKTIEEKAKESGLTDKIKEGVDALNAKLVEIKEDIRKKEPKLVEGAEKVHQDATKMADELTNRLNEAMGKVNTDVKKVLDDLQKNPEVQEATKKLQEIANEVVAKAKSLLEDKKGH